MLTIKRILTCAALTLAALIVIPWSAATPQDDQHRNSSQDYASATLKLLQQSFDARKNMILTDVKIENSDEEQVEVLEQQLETFELAYEEAEFRLELIAERRNLNLLLTEIQEEGLNRFTQEIQDLLRLLDKRSQLAEQLFETLRANQDSDDSTTEDKLEAATVDFETRYERLELQIALADAETYGDSAEVEALKSEIRELTDIDEQTP